MASDAHARHGTAGLVCLTTCVGFCRGPTRATRTAALESKQQVECGSNVRTLRLVSWLSVFAAVVIGSGCGGGSTGTNTSTNPFSGQYQALWLNTNGTGRVTVNSAGAVSMMMHTSGANPSFALSFCNFGRPNPCLSLGTVVGDASGNINTNLTIAEHGPVAGVFIGTLN